MMNICNEYGKNMVFTLMYFQQNGFNLIYMIIVD